ncbi:MAG TPA: hypothetical protein VFD58_00450 [Blastocatellia bacterium]|nr:hypothetical protein [Blastocatellia bacterium]
MSITAPQTISGVFAFRPADHHSRLATAQERRFVVVDPDDGYDPVALAFRQWCAEVREPYILIEAGNHCSRVTLSLIEMKAELTDAALQQVRERLPQVSLMSAGIVVEPDYCTARWVLNDEVFEVAGWLYSLAWWESEKNSG